MLDGILFSIFHYSMKHFWLPLVWFILIFIACAMPGKDIPHISFLELLAFDKWVHAGIFFILTLLLMRGMKLTYVRIAHRTTGLFALFVSVTYGGLLEIMQGTFFEDRSADVYDFIANSFGVICGVLLYRKLAARMKFFCATATSANE